MSLLFGSFSFSYALFSSVCGQKVHFSGQPIMVVISKVGISYSSLSRSSPDGSRSERKFPRIWAFCEAEPWRKAPQNRRMTGEQPQPQFRPGVSSDEGRMHQQASKIRLFPSASRQLSPSLSLNARVECGARVEQGATRSKDQHPT